MKTAPNSSFPECGEPRSLRRHQHWFSETTKQTVSYYRTLAPPIKCQGIKTKLTPWIRSVIPAGFEGRWIEPFMGSGVVAFNIRPRRALLADSNPHLIAFYQAIADGVVTPSATRRFLEREGAELLRSDGESYYTARERFNRLHDPLDFLFLNRSCFNGLIRFNRKGEFNVPFCHKPNRFAQAYITKICNQVKAVAETLTIGDYSFVCQDMADTIGEAVEGDLLYCDPPYIDRHSDYFNAWGDDNERELSRLLSDTPSDFILSTWHSNRYRQNVSIEKLWHEYHILTREHFYHVGAKERNRNAMLEALVTNFAPAESKPRKPFVSQVAQGRLLEGTSGYGK